MQIIDTHAHYSHGKYPNRLTLLPEMHYDGVDKIIDVGTNSKSINKTLQLISLFPFVYGGIGYFPSDVLELESNPQLIKDFSKLLNNNKIVYLGEIGLDYHWKTVEPKLQEKWFRKQIELAIEKDMPISIHSREAEKDTIRIIKDYPETKGIVHCFSYGIESMEFFVNHNFYIGVGGTITYPSNKNTIQAIQNTPLNRIVTETDAPYLTPVPYRREINDSRYIKYVIKEIAKIKNINTDIVEKKVFDNALNILKL